MNDLEKWLVHSDRDIPLKIAADFFIGVRTATASSEKTASLVDAPDETGELEGTFEVPPEQMAALLQNAVTKTLALQQAANVYSATVRGPTRPCFDDWAYSSIVSLLSKRAAVLAGGVHIGDIDPPPAVTDPKLAARAIIRGEQELMHALREIKLACGENPLGFTVAQMAAKAQERVDDLWRFLEPEAPAMPNLAPPEGLAGHEAKESPEEAALESPEFEAAEQTAGTETKTASTLNRARELLTGARAKELKNLAGKAGVKYPGTGFSEVLAQRARTEGLKSTATQAGVGAGALGALGAASRSKKEASALVQTLAQGMRKAAGYYEDADVRDDVETSLQRHKDTGGTVGGIAGGLGGFAAARHLAPGVMNAVASHGGRVAVPAARVAGLATTLGGALGGGILGARSGEALGQHAGRAAADQEDLATFDALNARADGVGKAEGRGQLQNVLSDRLDRKPRGYSDDDVKNELASTLTANRLGSGFRSGAGLGALAGLGGAALLAAKRGGGTGAPAIGAKLLKAASVRAGLTGITPKELALLAGGGAIAGGVGGSVRSALGATKDVNSAYDNIQEGVSPERSLTAHYGLGSAGGGLAGGLLGARIGLGSGLGSSLQDPVKAVSNMKRNARLGAGLGLGLGAAVGLAHAHRQAHKGKEASIKVADFEGGDVDAPMSSPSDSQQLEPANYLAAELRGRQAQEQNESAYYRDQLRSISGQNTALQQQMSDVQMQLQQLQEQSDSSGSLVQQANQQAIAANDEALRHAQIAANMRMGMQQMRAQLMELASQDPSASASQELQGVPTSAGLPGAVAGPEVPPDAANEAAGASPTAGAAPVNGGLGAGSGTAEPPGTAMGNGTDMMAPGNMKIGSVADKLKAALPGALLGAGAGFATHKALQGAAPGMKEHLAKLEERPTSFMNSMRVAAAKAGIAQAERADAHPGASAAWNTARGALAGAATIPAITDNIRTLVG